MGKPRVLRLSLAGMIGIEIDQPSTGTLTVALYIVTDMEYPRLGLIRIEAFDHFLMDADEQMR